MPRVHGIDLPRHRRRHAVFSRSASIVSNSHSTQNFGSNTVDIHLESFRSNSEGTVDSVTHNCSCGDAKSITPGKIEPRPHKELDRLKFGNTSFSVSTISISSLGNDTHTTLATPNSSTMHCANSGAVGNSSTMSFSDRDGASNKKNQHINIPDGFDQDRMKSNTSIENAAEEKVDQENLQNYEDANFEFKYEDDSSVTTMGDDVSVDLLQDDDGYQNGKSTESSSVSKLANLSQDISNENFAMSPKRSQFKCAGTVKSKYTPSPISPATETLNRLADVGTKVEETNQVEVQPKQDDGGDDTDKSFHLLDLAASNKWEEQNVKEDNKEKKNEEHAETISLDDKKKEESMYESEGCSEEDDNASISSEIQQEKTPPQAQKISNYSNRQAKKEEQTKRQKEQIIRDLKNYFMSTKNSSEYAKKNSLETPLVPFCHRCTKATANNLPHHALCPKHPDFFNSGSYEILCILVDGFDHKCEACMFQFDNGRPNKKLGHSSRCNRSDRKKGSGVNLGESQQTKSPSSCKHIQVDVPLTISAQSGCRKCKQELETGEKSSLVHDILCPRRRKANHLPPLSTCAASGCKKCISEMRTGRANSRGHDKCCPRRRKIVPRNVNGEVEESVTKNQNITPRKRKDRPPLAAFAIPFLSPPPLADAAEVCKKCRTELEEGVKTADSHDPSCPRKRANRVSRELQSLQHPKDDMLARELGTYQKSVQGGNSYGLTEFVPGRKLDSPSKERLSNLNDEVQILKNDDSENDDPPLSEYERLRLRNIKRNESRLAQLGLLVPSCNKQDGKPKSTLNQNRDRREKKVAPKMTKKRSLPHRQAKYDQIEKQNIAGNISSSSAKSHNCSGSYSLEFKRTKNASNPSAPTNKQQTSILSDQNNNCKVLEKDGHVACCLTRSDVELQMESGSKSGQKHEVKSNILHSPGRIRTKIEKLQDATDSSLDLAEKDGREKCTLKRQTENQDLLSTHDLHCPRHPKGCAKHVDHRNPLSNLLVAQRSSSLNHFRSVMRSITPSPALHYSNPQDFPSFVASFLSKPNDTCNSEIPASKGAKWLPCPNPWGEVGHNEGDFVVISPFQSESANVMLSAFHQGPNFELPKRFLANPLVKDSCYLSTHRYHSRGGYNVLSLKRDRMAMKPWGFTVRRHEFGGACLVQSVEPLSPAAGAEDISGWQNEDSSLKINDMILCMNGKIVGGMTEFEFQIEMDLCGPTMMLVVSRFDVVESAVATHEQNSGLGDLAMDWNDIGAGVLCSNERANFGANAVNAATYLNEKIESQLYEFEGSLTAVQVSTPTDSRFNGVFNQENEKTQSTYSQHSHHHCFTTKPNIPSHTKKTSVTSTSTDDVNFNSQNNLRNPPTKHLLPHRNDKLEPVNKNSAEPGHIGDVTGFDGGHNKFNSTLSNDEAPKEVGQDLRHVSVGDLKDTATKLYGCQKPGCRDIDRSRRIPSNLTKARGHIPPKAVDRYRRMLDAYSESGTSDVEEIQTGPTNAKKAHNSGKESRHGNQVNPKISNEQSIDDSSHSNVEEEEFVEEDYDENPWLGCVCSNTHPYPIKVFWIQCELCESWYNVAEECVGFDEKTAGILDEWFCWACKPPVAGLGL